MLEDIHSKLSDWRFYASLYDNYHYSMVQFNAHGEHMHRNIIFLRLQLFTTAVARHSQ